MISLEKAKKKFSNRSGLVFIHPANCSEASVNKLEQVFLRTKIINKPFQNKTRVDLGTAGIAYLFICEEGEMCKSAEVWQACAMNPKIAFPMQHLGARVDALAAFLRELKVDTPDKKG